MHMKTIKDRRYRATWMHWKKDTSMAQDKRRWPGLDERAMDGRTDGQADEWGGRTVRHRQKLTLISLLELAP